MYIYIYVLFTYMCINVYRCDDSQLFRVKHMVHPQPKTSSSKP